MPKYPVLSGKEVIKILEQLGFRVVRQRGSHVVLRKDTENGTQGCVVPLHKEIKRGTLGDIVKQAGIDPDEFLATYRQ